jgi:hypothetical protein
MNFLDKLAEFSTIEEGEKNLKEAIEMRDKMGGALYWNIVNDDCKEIEFKLWKLKLKKDANTA